MKKIFPGLLILILLFSCQKEVVNPPENNIPDNTISIPGPSPAKVQETKLVTSTNNFAFNIFNTLRSEDPSKNLFISPLSIASSLTMAFNGANGTTKETMRQVIGFGQQTDQEINKSFEDLQRLLFSLDKNVVFTSTNAIWHDENLALQDAFVQQNKTAFDATVRGLNFKSPTAINTINDWVKESTQGKIPSIIQEIKKDEIMFLINAIYFKATWTYPFKLNLTDKSNFYKEDGSIASVDFMTLTNGKYLYYSDADKQVIDLFYGNRQLSMTLILPDEKSKVSHIIRDLSSSKLSEWLSKADTSGATLRLPKFKMEFEKELNHPLTVMGMGNAFSADKADFGKMVLGISRDIAISKVVHKTFLDVNELGTEAAAATNTGTFTTSFPLTINRPFVFLIREKSTNAILFIGQLMNPQI